MILLESESQFPRVPVVTLLAHGLQINFVELALDGHLLVAGGAGEVVDAPGLVEGGEDVALDDLVTDIAEIAEELVVVSLAVGEALPLVVAVAQEGFLALGTDEVLDAPVLAQRGDHSALDGPPAGSADGDAHLVVAPETVELVELLGGVARPGPHLPSGAGQLDAAALAVEVIGTVVLAPEPQRLPFYGKFTYLAHVLPHTRGFHLGVTLVTESPALVLDEPEVGELLVAHLAGEALRVPGRPHRLDDSSDDELPTFGAAGSEEDVEAVFTIFPVLKVVENSVREPSEALSAHEAAHTEQLPVAVDNLGVGLEPVLASSARDAVEVHDPGHD